MSTEIDAPVCLFWTDDYQPCVVVHGDYCYSADYDNEPACRGCGRGPKFTGVPKPRGFDQMMRCYLAQKSKQ